MADIPEPSEPTEKIGIKRLIYIIIWTFKLYFRISPINTTLFLICSIILETRNLFYTYLFARILDQIVTNIQNGTTDLALLYPYLWTLLGYMIIFEAFFNTAYNYFRRNLSQTSRLQINKLLYEHLNTLGIQTLENPDTVNLIKRAEMWMGDALQLLMEAVEFVSNLVVVIIAALIIYQLLPIMVPILLVYAFLNYLPENYFTKRDFRWQVNNTEPRRMANTSSSILTDPRELQEVNINNSFSFFDKKFTTFTKWYLDEMVRIIKNRELSRFALAFLGKFITIYAYIRIITNAIAGTISVGSVIFNIRSLDYFSSSLGGMLTSLTYINEFGIKINDAIKLFELKPTYKDGTHKLGKLEKPPVIEFKNVSFKYANSEKFIFENLNLKIKSGEKLAIVGHNGAGKTTLIKLIAKIYPVTSGEILIDGINISEIKTSEWYKNLGVLFQEFNFYGHLTAKENIYLGNPSEPIDEKRIVEAAVNADADEFIMEYKNGYDQLLSERYKGGIRPSTGQMQKIAIAKFFYRNAPVAIFDEPTAAIDAVSEYKIFNKIYSFFEKKSVVIISHRFSTVRNADRIIVIEKGKIIEEGSHSELIAKNGAYAHAFKLQAEGYQESAS